MKKKDKETTLANVILAMVIVTLFLFLIFLIFRFSCMDFSYDDYCQEKYGEGWFYGSNEHYGGYCGEIDNKTFELIDTEEVPTHKEMREYCGVPKFFSFEKKARCFGD